MPETLQSVPAFDIRQHRRYNPAAVTSLNIVPGLLGVILTMTMLIFTALSVTREIERGTLESLLAMPIKPLEIMIGKIAPYVVIGFIQAALILTFGTLVFEVPIIGNAGLLVMLSTLFIATNLAIGYTFSTIAQNQLQAIQMSFMFFLPNILLSGFMFPFAGMPRWAQVIGECLPLTHYIRIVRGIMLKGADLVRPASGRNRPRGSHADCHDACRAPLPHDAGLIRSCLVVALSDVPLQRVMTVGLGLIASAFAGHGADGRYRRRSGSHLNAAQARP